MSETRAERRLRYLRSEINANFIISCKGREWKVDRGILCAESGYFERLCLGKFQEGEDGKAKLDDTDPEIIDQILVYIYTGQYDDLAPLRQLPSTSNPDLDQVPEAVTSATSATDPQPLLDMQPVADALPDKAPELSGPLSRWKCLLLSHEPCVELEQAQETTITLLLKTAVGVYQHANMFGLPELCEVSAKCFLSREPYWEKSNLADVLEAVFTTTVPDDQSLRLPTFVRCLLNYSRLEHEDDDCKRMLSVLNQHEPLAWLVSIDRQRLIELQHNDIYDNQRGKEEAKKECDRLNLRIAHLSDRFDMLQEDFEDVQSASADFGDECTKCGRELTCSKWIKQRAQYRGSTRPQYMCKCGKKYTATRERRVI